MRRHPLRRLRFAIRRGGRPAWWALVAVLVGGGVLLAGGLALAADSTVHSSSSMRYTPTNPTPSIPGGGSLDFDNSSSGVPHNVTANLDGPDGKSLFKSGTFDGNPGGVTRAVKGVQYLPAGNYTFHCTVHPTTMKGTLRVTSGGHVARPNIDVAILSRRIGQVRSTKRLKVRVDAQTKSNNVALVAKKGTKTLARKSNVDLGAGDSKTTSMHLTRKGRRALKGLDHARIKLHGTVPFGAPDSARRTLR